VIDPNEIVAARRALGRQLARYRQATGLSQHQLAPHTRYGRSTVANVEVGRQNVPRSFWERADAVLGAGGTLTAQYDGLEALVRRQRRELAEAVGDAHLPGKAQAHLEQTTDAMRDRPKVSAIVLGNLILAYLRQRKLAEATATLHAAIDEVERTRGGGGLNLVFAAGRELRPWRQEPAVQDVHDRLLALMA
jgi:hypothetical protein